jgi:hypothetical protein
MFYIKIYFIPFSLRLHLGYPIIKDDDPKVAESFKEDKRIFLINAK